jgi:hypothetical protein
VLRSTWMRMWGTPPTVTVARGGNGPQVDLIYLSNNPTEVKSTLPPSVPRDAPRPRGSRLRRLAGGSE